MKLKVIAAVTLSMAVPLGVCRPATACATVSNADDLNTHVQIVDESAVIVWDEAHQVQHFIRRANFASTARDIGFLVPSPTVPQLAAAQDAAFNHLERLIEPEVIERQHREYVLSSVLLKRDFNLIGGASEEETAITGAAPRSAVQVLSTQRVAGYDAAVLQAEDAAALNRWLKKHGYVSNPALAEWLRPYLAARWKITAFKIASSNPADQTFSSSTVRMSFATPRPFFPYREPATQRDKKQSTVSRSLRVFFIGDERASGAIGQSRAKAWPGRTTWADALPVSERAALAKELALLPAQLPSQMQLTVFEDTSSPRPGVDDVYFTRAADQSRILPPPVVIDREVIMRIPLELIALLIVAAFVAYGWFTGARAARP